MYLQEVGSGGNGGVGYTKFTKNGLWAVVCFLGTYDGGFGLSLRGLGRSQMGKSLQVWRVNRRVNREWKCNKVS